MPTGLLPELRRHLGIAAAIGDEDDIGLLQRARVGCDQLQPTGHGVGDLRPSGAGGEEGFFGKGSPGFTTASNFTR